MKRIAYAVGLILIPLVLCGIGNLYAGEPTDIIAFGDPSTNEIRFNSDGNMVIKDTTFEVEDTSGNDLFVITDSGTTGDLTSIGTITLEQGVVFDNQTVGQFKITDGTNTLFKITDSGVTGDLSEIGTITFEQDLVLDNQTVANLKVTDGTNTLVTITDAGTTGNLDVSGTLTIDGTSTLTGAIDAAGEMEINANSLASVEAVTTSDTVAVTETGKIFAMNISTGTVTMTLPAAAAGDHFYFVDVNGNHSFYIDPNGSDTIKYAPSSIPMGAGDRLYSGGVTGDSVHLYAYTANSWAVLSINGTWTDGN